MRKLLGVGGMVLGGVGVLLCAVAIAASWWIMIEATAGLNRVADRLDGGLSDADRQLGRVELRMNAIRMDLVTIRDRGESLVAEHTDPSRIRAEAERLLDKLFPAFEEVGAVAVSLQSQATLLRTAVDVVEQVHGSPAAIARAREVAEKIERAVELLNGLQARVAGLKSMAADQLPQQLAALTRELLSGSERLGQAIAAARHEIAEIRNQIVEWRDKIVLWIHSLAAAATFVWVWGGVSQLCLIGWGRRRFGSTLTSPALVT